MNDLNPQITETKLKVGKPAQRARLKPPKSAGVDIPVPVPESVELLLETLSDADQPPPQLPINKPIRRYEDMSPDGSLVIHIQNDGDVIVSARPSTEYAEREGISPFGVSVEFCSCSSGGGQSPKVLAALRNLARAIIEDNESKPQNRTKSRMRETI